MQDTTTDIAVNTGNGMTASPGMRLVNLFAHYAASEGAEAFFDGDYVKIDQERGWIRGQKKEPIGATEAFVAKMPEAGGRSSTCRYDRSPIPTMWCASPPPARSGDLDDEIPF